MMAYTGISTRMRCESKELELQAVRTVQLIRWPKTAHHYRRRHYYQRRIVCEKEFAPWHNVCIWFKHALYTSALIEISMCVRARVHSIPSEAKFTRARTHEVRTQIFTYLFPLRTKCACSDDDGHGACNGSANVAHRWERTNSAN